MYEGVEAGENEQRHHRAQRHHIVELQFQKTWRSGLARGLIAHSVGCQVAENRLNLQSVGEVLKKDGKMNFNYNGPVENKGHFHHFFNQQEHQ